MNKNLQKLQHILRHLHLLNAIEHIRYRWSVVKNSKKNRIFKQEHPGFALPPAHLAYDAYSAPDWEYYYRSGIGMAEYLVSVLKKYTGDAPPSDILEWGCGPARIIRHLPGLLGPDTRIYGSDYNPETIQWAQQHIEGIAFSKNELKPPLPFDDASFDFVYAFSVFTHLSESVGQEWIDELARVLKDDGILFFKANGDQVAEYLLPREKDVYDTKGFIQRGNQTEGKKMFGAFHAPEYVRKHMLKPYTVLEHIPGGQVHYLHIQDGWIVRRNPRKEQPPSNA